MCLNTWGLADGILFEGLKELASRHRWIERKCYTPTLPPALFHVTIPTLSTYHRQMHSSCEEIPWPQHLFISYKGKHLIWGLAYLQRFSPLSVWLEAWWHAGRHRSGEVTKSSISRSASNSKRATLILAWTLKPQSLSPVRYFLQQGHIYQNNDTPLKSATSWWQCIPI